MTLNAQVNGRSEDLPRPWAIRIRRPPHSRWSIAAYPTTSARAYRTDLRAWATWCATLGVHPLAARRHHVDAWIRHLTTTAQRTTGRPAPSSTPWRNGSEAEAKAHHDSILTEFGHAKRTGAVTPNIWEHVQAQASETTLPGSLDTALRAARRQCAELSRLTDAAERRAWLGVAVDATRFTYPCHTSPTARCPGVTST